MFCGYAKEATKKIAKRKLGFFSAGHGFLKLASGAGAILARLAAPLAGLSVVIATVNVTSNARLVTA